MTELKTLGIMSLGRNESRELLKMPKPKLLSISFKYMKNKGNASLGILFQSEPVLSGLFNIKWLHRHKKTHINEV